MQSSYFNEMKLIDICVIILFQKQHVLLYSIKNKLQSEAATGGVRNFVKKRL